MTLFLCEQKQKERPGRAKEMKGWGENLKGKFWLAKSTYLRL